MNSIAGIDIIVATIPPVAWHWHIFLFYAFAYSASNWPAMTENTMTKSLLYINQGLPLNMKPLFSLLPWYRLLA
jgi:hypothetical protein